MLKQILTLYFIIISSISVAGTKIIECSETSCNPDFIPDLQADKLYYTSLDLGDLNQDNIIINVNNNGEPRSVRLSSNQNTVQGKDVQVNLTPNSDNSNAGDFVLVGDFFNKITINLDGFDGEDGKNSSRMCYEEYEKQDDGAFSAELKEKFDEARFLEPTLPRTQCVSFDVDNLFDSFQCDDGYHELEDTNNPSVIVKRLKGKNRCLGLGYINVCLSKTLQITCKYKIKYTSPPLLAGTFDNSTLKQETRILKIPEQEYYEKISDPNFKEFLCNNLSYVDGVTPPEDIIQNGEFYFNIAGWSNQNAIWRNTEEMVLLGDEDTRNEQAYAQQLLSTVPGERYRVQATWKKDQNKESVDSGQVNIYSDINKTNLMYQENIYERGSIKPVFLTSDDAPYDYGFSIVNSTLEKVFTIKNKDSRPATNCSVVYLTGDTNTFSIREQTCGINDLGVGESCTVTVRANPLSYGEKTATLKRDCEDDYGNFTSTLNEEMSLIAYKDFIQPAELGAPDPSTKFVDGFYWRYDISFNRWLKCEEDYNQGKNCYSNATVASFEEEFEPGKWFPGFSPEGMTYIPGQVNPTILFPELINKEDILVSNRIEQEEVDFIFTASNNNTILELTTLLPEHGAVFDKIIVTKLSPTAGPSIKPPADKKCPTANSPGCVSGSQGHGYYDLAEVTEVITQPGYDERYYTIPDNSDWRIRYVGNGESCPQYFNLEKREHLASNIGYDDNDELCDDVFIPEDPSSKYIQWSFTTFERLPEFGTELVQCTAGNCLVNYSIQEDEKNLVTFNLGSGTNGTQQGEGLLFIYDFSELISTAENGTGGNVGVNDLPIKEEPRVCAKISDAETEGLDSSWAKDPKVNFKMYNWKPIEVIEEGNFGKTPRNNGKTIKYYKKIDSSVRYLMKNEIF